MCMVKKSMLVAPPMGGKILIFYAFEFHKIFPLKCYSVVFVYLLSSWRGIVSLARACLESLDTIALI